MYTIMEFEFDQQKSEANKKKHGISFEEAQSLWQDSYRILIPAKNLDEPRFVLISKIQGKYWSAVYTVRENKIRLISVRRSRKNEKEIYEG